MLNDQDTGEEIEPKLTADYINNYFARIGPNLADNFTEPWVTNIEMSHLVMANMQTTESVMTKLVNEISYKASSIENVSSRLLKPAFQSLIPQLVHIFNLCLMKGIFPIK